MADDDVRGWMRVLKRAAVRFFDKGNFAGTSGTEMQAALERNQSIVEARIPPFRLLAVPIMLNDEYVRYGTAIIEGPIQSNLKVEIVAAGEEGSTSRVKGGKGSKKPSPFGAPDEEKPGQPKNPFAKEKPKKEPGEALAASPFFSQEGEEPTRADETGEDANVLEDADVQALNEPTGLPPEVEEYIRDNLNLFIDNCLEVAIDAAIKFGFGPSELCHDFYDDVPYVHTLESINPFVCDPYVDNFGRFDGIKVTKSGGNVLQLRDFMGYPKAFWPVHRRHIDKWFGESLYKAAYPTFYKKWSRKGYAELLRIWITKDAFDSGTLRYDSSNAVTINGQKNRDGLQVALNLLNQKMAGSGMALSSDFDPISGKYKWDYERPQINPPPGILLEAIQDCDARILLAMGVSPELAQNFSSGGFGAASGRAIPETAFYSTLMAIIKPIIVQDFKEQIMDKLLQKRFGRRFNYRLVVLPLAGDDESSSTDPPAFKPNEVPGGEQPPNGDQMKNAEEFVSKRFGSAA